MNTELFRVFNMSYDIDLILLYAVQIKAKYFVLAKQQILHKKQPNIC